MAKKAIGFGLKIITCDLFVFKVNTRIKMVNFSQLLSDSDFIPINTSLTGETGYAFGKNELKYMKKSAYLINTAWGASINEKSIYRALREKWIAGVVIDIMEKEPPCWEDPLLKLGNLIVTPHSAFYSEESHIKLKTKVANALLSVLIGGLPKATVNPEVIGKNN